MENSFIKHGEIKIIGRSGYIAQSKKANSTSPVKRKIFSIKETGSPARRSSVEPWRLGEGVRRSKTNASPAQEARVGSGYRSVHAFRGAPSAPEDSFTSCAKKFAEADNDYSDQVNRVHENANRNEVKRRATVGYEALMQQQDGRRKLSFALPPV